MTNTSRIIPNNFKAEQMLLGALLINSDVYEQIEDFLHKEHFFEPLHKRIFGAIKELKIKELRADPITIRSMLEKDPLYQDAKGDEYLINLTTLAMMVFNIRDYGKVVYDLSLKRNLIAIGEQIVNEAYESTLSVGGDEQLEKAENRIFQLADKGLNEKEFLSLHEAGKIAVEQIEKTIKQGNTPTGVTSGIDALDYNLWGFQNSDLIIIAGRPSMGKTAFAVNFAYNACKSFLRGENKNKVRSVLFFSLEMSSDQLAMRMLHKIARLNVKALKSGKFGEEDYSLLRKTLQGFEELPFHIDDTPALSITAFKRKARKMYRKHNAGIIFVDYLQLMKGTSKENRMSEITEITQGLKALAKELNIPIIALAQLSRAVEQREDKRPLLSDLRESGSIEQDADVVMFIYREEYYLKRKMGDINHPEYNSHLKKLNSVFGTAEIIIAKHRNGSIGTVKVNYEDQYHNIDNF